MAEEAPPFTAESFYNYLSTEKRLMGVRCRACGKLSVEPRSICPACYGGDMEWHQFSGKGSLSAFTSISIVPVYMSQRGYGRSNPYCAGVIALEEGPRRRGSHSRRGCFEPSIHKGRHENGDGPFGARP